MRSIRTRIVILMCAAVFLCSFTLIFIGVGTLRSESDEYSDEILNATCESSTRETNARLNQIEHSLSTMVAYVDSAYDSVYELAKDSEKLETFQSGVEDLFYTVVSTNNAVGSYYIRYNPDLFEPTSGFWWIDKDEDGTYESYTPTDFSVYDEDDIEHVGWYYVPVNAKKAMWMDPYWNANINMYTLTYVAPLFDDSGATLGVIGMDINLDNVIYDVKSITLFDTGYAYLLSDTGTVIYHPYMTTGENIADQSSDIAQLAEYIKASSSNGKTFEYSYRGERRRMAFCSLESGMRFVVSVPVAEIRAGTHRAIVLLVCATALVTLICLVAAVQYVGKLLKPLGELTEAARRVEKGEEDIKFPADTNDEVGVLNRAMQGMVEQLSYRITGLTSMAYRDALTGVRNKGAFENEGQKLMESGEAYGIVVFDVNNLKTINDKYGHVKGDLYIQRSCALICDVFSHSPVFRYGGDEFVAVLKGRHVDSADVLIDLYEKEMARLDAEATEPWERMSVAKGVAFYDPESMSAEEGAVDAVFKRADALMYEDKKRMKSA